MRQTIAKSVGNHLLLAASLLPLFSQDLMEYCKYSPIGEQRELSSHSQRGRQNLSPCAIQPRVEAEAF